MNVHSTQYLTQALRRPFLFYLLCIGFLLNYTTTHAQPLLVKDTTAVKKWAKCGATGDYFRAGGVVPSGSGGGSGNFTGVSNFPSYATQQCGKFKIFYEDLINTNPQGGFSDPSYGLQRRNTLCAVLTYIQSVIDFSGVSAANPIRLYIDTSYSAANHSPQGTGWYAQAGPYFNANATGLINGYLHDYVTTSNDPISSTDYHARARFNFDSVFSGTNGRLIDWYNLDTGSVASCQNDLFSTMLHEITHALGWQSLIKFDTLSPFTPHIVGGQYTGIDNAVYVGTPGALTKLINSGAITSFANPNNNYWINGSNTPDNHPVFSGPALEDNVFFIQSFIGHLDDQVGSYTYCQHISPGDWQDYVMGPYGFKGAMRRRYTKIELQTLAAALNYTLTSTAATQSGVVLANHTPYSTRTRTVGQYSGGTTNWYECMPHDFPTLVNNVGNTITYYFANDPTIIDPDNDSVFAYPGSIINIRGCGNSAGTNGGNNHDQITPITNAAGRIIGFTYTPRHNFMGRAQFGLNLWDGKEKGGYVYYTIDVSKGNNVTAPAGSNLVLNGGFEEGTELKRIGADETLNNASADVDMSREGHFNLGAHFGDSHPFDWYSFSGVNYGCGLVVKNTFIDCGNGQNIKYPAGLGWNSCPGNNSWTYPPVGFPSPSTTGGNRYSQSQTVNGTFFLMADSVRSCHFYKLEYDTYALVPITGLPFGVGFVDSVTCNVNFANFFAQPYTPITPYKDTIATNFDSTWTHHTVHFWWCGDPKAILYFNTLGNPGNVGVLMDNISLKEDTAPQLTASVTQTVVTPCQTVKLNAQVNNTACTTLYTWLYNGQTVGSTDSLIVNVTTSPGVYTLIVSDGCRLDTVTQTVLGGTNTATITASSLCVPDTLTASPNGAGSSYSWTGPGGFTSAANPVIANQPGTYNVTVTSPNGCVASASYTINGSGNACCNAVIASTPGTVSFSNTTASAMLAQLTANGYATGSTVTTNNYIVIDGNFTVDVPLTFAACPHIVFSSVSGSPAQITLNSGQSLTIKNSILRAACGYMWTGITASDPGNTITVSGSELHDMTNGIICVNGALALVTSSQFIDNYTGLAFYSTPNNPNLNQPATYNGIIKSNSFTTSVNKLLPPYAGQSGKYGVYTNNTRYLTIGGLNAPSEGNSFSKLATGVYIDVKMPGSKLVNYVSTTNVYNNSFSDITGGAYGNQTGTPASQSIYNDPDGTAVYGKNYGTIPFGNVINVTNSTGSTAQFTNCSKGITLTGMSANVTNTRYNNLTWGVNLGNASQTKINVNNNYLQNVYYGVSVSGSPNAMSINRNNYNSPNTYFQTFNYSVLIYPVGITLSEITNTSGVGTLDSIASDTLNMNALAGIGIYLQNTGTEVKALKNLISLNPPNSGSASLPNVTPEMFGIATSNALGSTIAGNHINGNAWALTTNRTNVADIAMSSSQQLRLNCNHVRNTRYGFLTVGNCTTDTLAVTSNEFYGHTNGILFRHLGVPGTFGQIGKRNYDNYNTFGGIYATNGSSYMKLYTMSICNVANQPPIFTGQLQPSESGGNNASCRYSPQQNISPVSLPQNCTAQGLPRIGKVPDIDAAILIARDLVTYDEYEDVARWLDQSQLFDQLTTDTDARTNYPVLDSFYQAMLAHPISDVSGLNDKLQDIENALAQGDADLYAQLLDQAQNANGNIGNSDQMAANERQINDVYIRYSKKGLDSLTTTDSSVIASLALQCPLIGGSAVYKARMLYGLIAPVRGYDDIDICNSAGAYKGGKHPFDDENSLLSGQHAEDLTGNGFKVYPNPANETVTVDYTRGGTFTLTDMLGRVIKTVALGERAGKITVDIHTLIPGVYTYSHIVDGKQVDFGKLVVTK